MPVFVCFLLGLTPLLWLLLYSWQGMLGANPVELWLRLSGDWGLWCLLLTLALSPLSRWRMLQGVLRWRRMVGLFSFFYALLHLTVYLVLERALSWEDIAQDIGKRPYITVGILAFVLLLPLALTSPRRIMLRLGSTRIGWHRLVYPAALLVILHFFLQTRADWHVPLLHAVVLAVLLAWRLVR
ncbi:MAG: ferric reductase-like transmembrane domain-containing protein [Magnetococcales bacterium]|nr:ferric reductase-like transmembrane domain-containing protein [Magnetococcales bacterium]MBF0113491.1 ferric reductase-like transmembrane domain-containing protein [Magnetococcales bacterium]